jgi:hypothetical protein
MRHAALRHAVLRHTVLRHTVALSIVAGALVSLVIYAAAPASAATPAPLSGTADALTQSAGDSGTWQTTAYLNTAALCAEPVTFALQLTPSAGKPVPSAPVSGLTANCGAAEAASPITAVKLSFTLGEVPQSATLVVTPSPVLAASESQLDITITVQRHVSVLQYLVIPLCCGVVLAVLLILAMMAFGVPRPGRRNARMDTEDFWRRPLYAASAWTFGDSWVTNITAVGTLIGTVLTASSGVAFLLPGVDQGRFSLLLAMAGGVSIIAPLIFALLNYRFSRQNPATAGIVAISLPAKDGGFRVTMPVGGGVAVAGGATLDGGQVLSPGTTLDVPVGAVVTISAANADDDDSRIVALPGSNDIVLPPGQRITVTPAIGVPPGAIQAAPSADPPQPSEFSWSSFLTALVRPEDGQATATRTVPATATVASLTLSEGAKLSFVGRADITLPAGSSVGAVGEMTAPVQLSAERTFSLPFTGEVVSQMWSMLLASSFTMFGIGADLAIVGWVLGYDLAAAPPWARATVAALSGLAAVVVVLYGVFAIRALADSREGSVLSGRRGAAFIL